MEIKQSYAPVALFVYNRLDHTQKTIDYLLKNNLAEETELFIFSDAPKTSKQDDRVKAVREYIHTVHGFKKITIVEAAQNKGLAKSIISGVTELVNKYDKVIVLEDDLLTAPCFLKYMNDALRFYADEKAVWSITGYQYPIDIPENYPHSVYLSYRGCSWGWSIWKDRWETVDWDVKDFSAYKYNPFKIAHFCKGGTDLDKMLRYQMKGLIDSWAVRSYYSQSKQNRYTVHPCKSLITNIGTDGSGTHFTEVTNRYDSEMCEDFCYKFTHDLAVDRKIMRACRKIVDRSIIRRLKRIVINLLGKKS